MTMEKDDIRAIVIDDSRTARELLISILEIADGVHVVGSGANGNDAIRLTRRMRPDILLMDVSMPAMGGLEATKHIMASSPTPIVLVSGTLKHRDIDLSFEAVRAGALTVVAKPSLADPQSSEDLLQVLRSMASVPVVRRWRGRHKLKTVPKSQSFFKELAANRDKVLGDELLRPFQFIGIASSTGGPGALAALLKGLPADFNIPILIVQHVMPGFDTGLAEWLDKQTPLSVALAPSGGEPKPGTVFIAPDGYHLQIDAGGAMTLRKESFYKGLRPSANYLFASLARFYAVRSMGIVLTGMGDDGAEGLLALHQAGGLTLAQDEASSVVYGMPYAAMSCGAVDAVLSLEEIALALVQLSEVCDVRFCEGGEVWRE